MCNAVRNISKDRIYLCAWHGSDHLGYQHLRSMGVNYVSMIVGREPYFMWEVHLEIVCNSNDAYAVYVYISF